MPLDIKKAKAAGYNDDEILDYLSKAKAFNLSKAKESGYSNEELITHLNVQTGPLTNEPKQIVEPLQGTVEQGMGLVGKDLTPPSMLPNENNVGLNQYGHLDIPKAPIKQPPQAIEFNQNSVDPSFMSRNPETQTGAIDKNQDNLQEPIIKHSNINIPESPKISPTAIGLTIPRAARSDSFTSSTVANIMPTVKVEPIKTSNRVVVSLPDKKMAIYSPEGKIIDSFPVFIGMASAPTPKGKFRILEDIDKSEQIYGPGFISFNQVGESNFGIHGWKYTKNDDDEEKANPGWKTTTHGCVQLNNDSMLKFSQLIGLGDSVTIVDEPQIPVDPHRDSIKRMFKEGLPNKASMLP